MSSNSIFCVLAVMACLCLAGVLGLQIVERGYYIAERVWPVYSSTH